MEKLPTLHLAKNTTYSVYIYYNNTKYGFKDIL